MHGWGQSLPLLWGEGVLSSDGRGTERQTDRQRQTERQRETETETETERWGQGREMEGDT